MNNTVCHKNLSLDNKEILCRSKRKFSSTCIEYLHSTAIGQNAFELKCGFWVTLTVYTNRNTISGNSERTISSSHYWESTKWNKLFKVLPSLCYSSLLRPGLSLQDLLYASFLLGSGIYLSLSCDSVSFLEFSKSPRWVIRWFWDNALCQFSRYVAIRIIRDCSDLVHEMNTEFHTLIYLASAWTFCLRWLFT